MKLRNPWLIRLCGFFGSWLVRWWMDTLTYRLVFQGEHVYPIDARLVRYLYIFWHETLLFPIGFRKQAKVHILISQHADGELISQACRHLRVGLVRGSSTRGGAQALLDLVAASQRTHLLVTPDGPRGPRRHVQAGLIFVASRTGLPVVPCGVGYAHAWRAPSWDRFAVPLPWTRAVCVVGQPIKVPAQLDRRGIEEYRRRVEEAFLQATTLAENLAQGRRAAEGERARAVADLEGQCLTIALAYMTRFVILTSPLEVARLRESMVIERRWARPRMAAPFDRSFFP